MICSLLVTYIKANAELTREPQPKMKIEIGEK